MMRFSAIFKKVFHLFFVFNFIVSANASANESNKKVELTSSDSKSFRVKPRLGDRFFVFSILTNVFGPRAADFTQDTIMRNGSPFGGPCDVYEQVRIGDRIVDVKDPLSLCPNGKAGSRLPMIPTDSTVRQGRLTRACKELSEDKEALTFAIKKSKSIGLDSEIELKNIQNVYHLFDPSYDLTSEQTIKLQSSINSSKMSNPQKWKVLLETTCSDLFWQVL